MKKYIYIIMNHIAIFFGLLFILWLLLFLSAMIPNGAIRDNMEKSVFFYKERDAFELTNSDRLNSVADNYADSIWLNVAWNMGERIGLKSTIETNYYDGDELGENAGLYYTVMEGVAPNTDYSRYWHGTAMFIRFFHLFADVGGIKIIGFSFFLLIVALSLYILIRKKHWDLAVILILSLLAVQIWNIRLSIEYQPAFIISFVMIPLYLIFERKSDNYLTMLSVLSGTLVAFYDFLTTETVTILLPLLIVIGVRLKEKRLVSAKETFLLIVKCGICWLCAYGGAFVVKWIAASAVTGDNVFETALVSVTERMGNKTEEFGDKYGMVLSSVLANLTMIFGGTQRIAAGLAATGTLIFMMVLFSVWYLFKGKEKNLVATLLILGLGFVVIVRYMFLRNHSFLHCFFTYRALVSLVFALILAVWQNISLPHNKRRRK